MDQTGIKKALNHINDNYIIAVDIETTGLNTDSDNIIEFAAIKFLNGKYIDKYVTFVNPLRKITDEITGLTGISDNDVLNVWFIVVIIRSWLRD